MQNRGAQQAGRRPVPATVRGR